MRYSLFILAIWFTLPAIGQIGGKSSYEFLNVPYSARLSGLGGVNITAVGDVNMLFANPALLDEALSDELSFNYLGYPASIHLSTAGMAHYFEGIGTAGLGVQYISYGEFDTYDASGNLTGASKAGEFNLNTTLSQQVGNYRIGIGMKWASSMIADYSSNALMFDLGGLFVHPEKDLVVGLAIKNLGFVLTEYSETSSSHLPFDVQVGVSYKPTYMPFRISITGYNVSDLDVSYFEEGDNTGTEKPNGFDKVMSHFVIGTDVIVTKNINLRLGYNHLIRENLRLPDRGGLSGISFGFMVKHKKIELGYAYGGYHAAGGINNFTITTNVSRFMGGKKTINEDAGE